MTETTQHRPLIRIQRMYDTMKDSARLEYIDRSTGDVIGYINYKVWDEPVEDLEDRTVMEKQGRLSDIVLDIKYQKQGILTDSIDRILCDMKCMGAEKKVTLYSQSPFEVWEKFGFKIVDRKTRSMEKDITDIECSCVTYAAGVIGRL